MTKLSVATNSRDIERKIKKIETVLESFPEGANPKLIAYHSGLNTNTVKSILPKMANVTKSMRGIYRVVKEGDTPDLLTDWNFHNLILTYHPNHEILPTRIYEKNGDLGLELIVSKSNKCTLRLDCDVPLNVSSITLAYCYFRKYLNLSKEEMPLSQVYVSSIEFNKDYRNIRLDGINSISIDSLLSHFKLYQKSVSVRKEHKTKVPFSVNNVVEMLSSNPSEIDINIKLSEQQEQLARLTEATSSNSQLMFKLIDSLGDKRK